MPILQPSPDEPRRDAQDKSQDEHISIWKMSVLETFHDSRMVLAPHVLCQWQPDPQAPYIFLIWSLRNAHSSQRPTALEAKVVLAPFKSPVLSRITPSPQTLFPCRGGVRFAPHLWASDIGMTCSFVLERRRVE